MQLSNSQQRILADMGIQLWSLRHSEPAYTEQPSSNTSVEADEAKIDVSEQIALVMVMDTAELSEPAQRLLNAMLKAVALHPEQMMTMTVDEYKQLNTVTLANKSVLMMGEVVTEQLLPQLTVDNPPPVLEHQAKISACFSLEAMLQQPARKASAWQALKQLRSVF